MLFAVKRPPGILRRFLKRNCQHAWQGCTATVDWCMLCYAERKRLGVIVVRDDDGRDTGELRQSARLLGLQRVRYARAGWTIVDQHGNAVE